MIRIFRTGRHAHRSALSYPALAPLFEGTVEPVDRPEAADLYLFAHPADIGEAPRALVEDWRARRRPVVLLSEEPFWDTIWGRRPLARRLVRDTDHGPLPAIQLNHATCDIFRFCRIPYYLLTNHRFASAYAWRFARNAERRPGDWAARFAARPVDLTFMFERRPEPFHGMRWPEAGLIGLCDWRTKLAESPHPGRVERLGASWQGGPSRFDLRNWHLDKLALLDERTRLMGAFENTHHPDYLTEKIFDAFACGALPLYFAAPDHRIHGFGLPGASWVNLHDLPPAEAAARIAELRIDAGRLEAYAEAQGRLARLFGDTGLWVAERARLRTAVLEALGQVLDAHRSAPRVADPLPTDDGLRPSSEAPAPPAPV